MRLLYIVLSLLFYGSFISCKKQKDDTCPNNSPWYQQGVHLTFVSTMPGLADNIQFYVTRVNGSRVVSIDDVGAFAPVGYLQICGKKVYKASTQEYTDLQLLYDLDGNMGDKWVVETEAFGTKTIETVTLKEKNVSVTVPYDTFNTTLLEIIGQRDYPYSYYFYVTEDHGPIRLTGRRGVDINLELLNRNF